MRTLLTPGELRRLALNYATGFFILWLYQSLAIGTTAAQKASV